MKETEIRDYLAHNLYVISNELILIDTEYKLNNKIGTDGFIDILARDIYDNYVIIEVKRSKQSSRSAIHEIMKYASLLKSELRLKDSEIRVVIVSTEWEELYIPFCKWKDKIDWIIEGYKFNNDKTCVQITEKTSEALERQLSRNQLVFLYSSEKELKFYKNKLLRVIQENELQDFFLLELKNEGNIKVVYPFALTLVLQRRTEIDYISILIRREWNEEELFEYGYEGEELLVFLEECIYKYIIDSKFFNDVEICCPEKLGSMIAQQGWKLTNVHKYGYFIHENRDNEWFLRKSIGFEEGNNFVFSDICDTKFKLKFSEMINNVNEFLNQKDDMWDEFDKIWESVRMETLLRAAIQIYNCGNIIQNLIMFEINGETWELPYADIFLEYQDGSMEKIELLLAYSENEIKPYCYILDTLLKGNGIVYMQMLWSGDITYYNTEIMKNLGLTYDWKKYKYIESGWKMQRDLKKCKFSKFYKNHLSNIEKMTQWYLTHTIN